MLSINYCTIVVFTLASFKSTREEEAAAMGNALPERERITLRRFEAVPEIVGAPTGKLWYHDNIKDAAMQQSSD